MRIEKRARQASGHAVAGLCAILVGLSSCVGETQGELLSFSAAASGPADAHAGAPLDFVTPRGWHVELTTAKLHIGAIYLNAAQPVSGGQTTSCILPGTYVGQVITGLDVDLLSSLLQPFPIEGQGTSTPALTGQVWVTGGAIDTVSDATPILVVNGTADMGTLVRPFTGTITISSNRASTTAAQAGSAPICKQRIVTPIPTSVVLSPNGTLILRIDPQRMFDNVDFGALSRPSGGDTYVFDDESGDQPSFNLYQGLHAATGVYTFEWRP